MYIAAQFISLPKSYSSISAPEINISPVPDIVSGSQHFVPVTRNSCRSSVYDILLKFENLPVIVTGRKRILSVTHEIVSDSGRWPAVISCTGISKIVYFTERSLKCWSVKWRMGYKYELGHVTSPTLMDDVMSSISKHWPSRAEMGIWFRIRKSSLYCISFYLKIYWHDTIYYYT